MAENRPVFGFMHVATIGEWKSIFDEQCTKLRRSGLYDSTDIINVCKVGKHQLELKEKFYLVYEDLDLNLFEFPTLRSLYRNAFISDGLTWYIHLKGVSKTLQDFELNKEEYRSSTGQYSFYGLLRAERMWRKYMEHFVIEKYQDCINALENHDICGVHWKLDPLPHFAGNFWWARNDYIRKLEDPFAFWEKANDYPVGGSRLMAEFWIGSGNDPRAKVFWNNDFKLHHISIQPYEYSKIRIF